MATTSPSRGPIDMKRPSVVLLALAAGLFAAWIGYLAFLVLTTRHLVVLSRPQFLVADLWVVAQVDHLDGPVKVTEVVYAHPNAKADAPKEGTTIEVKNLAECKKDFGQPGAYILPLVWNGKQYRVPPVPPSPGYKLPPNGPEYHIYPMTPQTREQLEEMAGNMPRP